MQIYNEAKVLSLLVRKELLTHLLSFRCLIALVLQVPALLASFVVMGGQFEEAQRQHRANVTEV